MSFFNRILQGSFYALLVSLAINFAANNDYLEDPAMPSAKMCEKIQDDGRRRGIEEYDQFYQFYLCEHSKPGTKLLHFIATFNFLFLLLTGFGPKSAVLGIIQGYAFAWLGHFCVEFNKPATFKYPGWSFVSDFFLFQDLFRGRCRMW